MYIEDWQLSSESLRESRREEREKKKERERERERVVVWIKDQ